MSVRSMLAPLLLVCCSALALSPASTAPAAAGPRAVRIDYSGEGVEVARGSGDESRLRATPAGFKRFVRARLDVLFREAGSKPRCATSPTVVVDRYHGAGWASVGEGWYGACPGGGYAVLYRRVGSHWRTILGTQEARFCQDLAWYGVPAFVAGRTCSTEDYRAVPYRTHRTRTTSPEATARRAVSLAGGHAVVPARHVAGEATREQLQGLVDRGAHLRVDECARQDDGSPLSAQLGTAPYGCGVTATYRRDREESLVLRMAQAGEDITVTEVVALP